MRSRWLASCFREEVSRLGAGEGRTNLEDLKVSFEDSLCGERGHGYVDHLQEEAEMREKPA